MGLFSFNIDEFIRQLLPPFLRKEKLIDWHRAMLHPLKKLYGLFKAYRQGSLKRLRYNGQTIILENLLNDVLDPQNRAIRIITASDVNQPVYIKTPAEQQPVYLSTPVEQQPVYIKTPGEYWVNHDFIVEAADNSLTSAEESRLKALSEKYKLAGMVPRFRYQNGTIF